MKNKNKTQTNKTGITTISQAIKASSWAKILWGNFIKKK